MTNAEYTRRWRKKNPERWKTISEEAYKRRYADPVKRERDRLKQQKTLQYIATTCWELKAITPCVDCGIIDLPYLMDFDHRKGTNNRSPHATRTKAELERELKKCDIVCVRCHRIRTYKRRINAEAR